jgi:hypothetical protein
VVVGVVEALAQLAEFVKTVVVLHNYKLARRRADK